MISRENLHKNLMMSTDEFGYVEKDKSTAMMIAGLLKYDNTVLVSITDRPSGVTAIGKKYNQTTGKIEYQNGMYSHLDIVFSIPKLGVGEFQRGIKIGYLAIGIVGHTTQFFVTKSKAFKPYYEEKLGMILTDEIADFFNTIRESL